MNSIEIPQLTGWGGINRMNNEQDGLLAINVEVKEVNDYYD